jgi:hypothetical protein
MAGRLVLIGLLAACQTGCWHVSPFGSDAEVGGDADTDTDTDKDSDTGTGTNSGNECTGDGVWYDESSSLCWQDPPPSGTCTWSEANSYCDSLDLGSHTDWRLPNISELISLIRGCVDGKETGDLSPSACEMTPAGCAVTDSCDNDINCATCADQSGPGSGGCYWDPSLGGTCLFYWSSSSRVSSTSYAWSVNFRYGHVYSSVKTGYGYTRCFRGGP